MRERTSKTDRIPKPVERVSGSLIRVFLFNTVMSIFVGAVICLAYSFKVCPVAASTTPPSAVTVGLRSGPYSAPVTVTQ